MTTRVMLVDDAVVVRHILTDALSKDPELEVVGTAADGMLALEKLPMLRPDVVVLDVEMPNMDGIETLAAIKKQYPRIKVIMFSTLTSRGAAATMDAMLLGADDYVTKPANVGSVGAAIERINAELVPKIKALHRSAFQPGAVIPPPSGAFTVTAPRSRPAASPSMPASGPQSASPSTKANVIPSVAGHPPQPSPGNWARPVQPQTSLVSPQILAIAVSTGGPNALANLLPEFPGNFPIPIVIVQHIPPIFSKALADRLNTKCALTVAECVPGSTLAGGQVWIAPGDFHMTVQREGAGVQLATNQNPPENSCRPAADVLFRSVAALYGPGVLGLVLTGMGNDGLKGAQEIVRVGGHIIAQDEASSVVWGMPGAVVSAGIAEKILPLGQLAREIVARALSHRVPAGSMPPSRS